MKGRSGWVSGPQRGCRGLGTSVEGRVELWRVTEWAYSRRGTAEQGRTPGITPWRKPRPTEIGRVALLTQQIEVQAGPEPKALGPQPRAPFLGMQRLGMGVSLRIASPLPPVAPGPPHPMV